MYVKKDRTTPNQNDVGMSAIVICSTEPDPRRSEKKQKGILQESEFLKLEYMTCACISLVSLTCGIDTRNPPNRIRCYLARHVVACRRDVATPLEHLQLVPNLLKIFGTPSSVFVQLGSAGNLVVPSGHATIRQRFEKLDEKISLRLLQQIVADFFRGIFCQGDRPNFLLGHTADLLEAQHCTAEGLLYFFNKYSSSASTIDIIATRTVPGLVLVMAG